MTNPQNGDRQYGEDPSDNTPTEQIPVVGGYGDQTQAYTSSEYGSRYQPPTDPEPVPEDEEDYAAVAVDSDSPEGRLIADYRTWAAVQDFDERNLETVERYLASVAHVDTFGVAQPRHTLTEWVNKRLIIRQKQEPEDNTARTVMLVSAVVLLLALIVGVFAWGINRNSDREQEAAPATASVSSTTERTTASKTPTKAAPKMTEIPNLAGKTLKQAKAILAREQIAVNSVLTVDDDLYTGASDKAIVVRTTPEGGTEVRKSAASVSIVVKPIREKTKAPAPRPTETTVTRTETATKTVESTPKTTETQEDVTEGSTE